MGTTSPIIQVVDHLEVVTYTILMHLIRSHLTPSKHQAFPVMRAPAAQGRTMPAANLSLTILTIHHPC